MSNNDSERITTEREIDAAAQCIREALILMPTDSLNSVDEPNKRDIHNIVILEDIDEVLLRVNTADRLLRYAHPDYELSEDDLDRVSEYIADYESAHDVPHKQQE